MFAKLLWPSGYKERHSDSFIVVFLFDSDCFPSRFSFVIRNVVCIIWKKYAFNSECQKQQYSNSVAIAFSLAGYFLPKSKQSNIQQLRTQKQFDKWICDNSKMGCWSCSFKKLNIKSQNLRQSRNLFIKSMVRFAWSQKQFHSL